MAAQSVRMATRLDDRHFDVEGGTSLANIRNKPPTAHFAA